MPHGRNNSKIVERGNLDTPNTLDYMIAYVPDFNKKWRGNSCFISRILPSQ